MALAMISMASLAGILGALCFLDLASSSHREEIRMGLLVVSMMPVASATIAWASIHRADRSLSLMLLITSTLGAPLISFFGMWLLSVVDSRLRTDSLWDQVVWNESTMLFLLFWVLIPSCLGFVASRISSLNSCLRADDFARHLSLPVLLFLNYINASSCLPFIPWNILTVFEFMGAVVVYQGVVVLSLTIMDRIRSKWCPLTTAQERSIVLSALLKNTGAGLVLINSIVTEPALILLPILLSTLTQHLLASQLGRIQGWFSGRYRRALA
jgi:predicted Na+-dependent transporter